MKQIKTAREVLADIGGYFFHEVNLDEAGLPKGNFWVTNKRLVEWLTTNPDEQMAMHTAYALRKHAIFTYADMHYLPAQDTLAKLRAKGYGSVDDPYDTRMPPREYVQTTIDGLLQIQRHWQHGRRLKLNPYVVILHDEIYGLVPYRFSDRMLQAAQALYDYMDKEVCGKGATDEVMERFADKVCEVRAKYLAEGWLSDQSLAFAYLMSHAEWCANWGWQGENETL
jgi:hypothetical protein